MNDDTDEQTYLIETAVWIHYNVFDTGIGIPEKAIATLFRRYRQVHEDHTYRLAATAVTLLIVLFLPLIPCSQSIFQNCLISSIGVFPSVPPTAIVNPLIKFALVFLTLSRIGATPVRQSLGQWIGKTVNTTCTWPGPFITVN
ncbi:unnamed protein product [Lathyrus sativus]|nr:unnamed protein product [Lathyrus sativus]